MTVETTASAADLMSDYDISPTLANVLGRYSFDRAGFDARRRTLTDGGVDPTRNHVDGEIAVPSADDLVVLPPLGSSERDEVYSIGAEALAAGQVGVVLLAGGMATRFGGGVKAVAEVLPGLRFIDVKIKDLALVAADHNAAVELMLMTSFQSDDVLTALAEELSVETVRIRTAAQSVSLRVTPTGELFRGADGEASPYAPGHGDLGDALRMSGLLEDFLAGGGRQLFVTNVDNTGATLDAAVIGLHLQAANPLTCEVTRPATGVTGGAPYILDGHLQILESFRIPPGVDQFEIPAVNTNSLVIDAERLLEPNTLTWFEVEKLVDGNEVVQFERLVGELSATMSTTMALVDSDGIDGRFQPAKDPAELERRRPGICKILEGRGII